MQGGIAQLVIHPPLMLGSNPSGGLTRVTLMQERVGKRLPTVKVILHPLALTGA